MHQRTITELYRSLALAASTSIGIEATLLQCVSRICTLIGWPVGHLYLPTADAERLVSSSIWYLADPARFGEFKEGSERIAHEPGLGLVGSVYRSGQPIWVSDLRSYKGFRRSEYLEGSGLRSAVAFPIRLGERVEGIVELFSDHMQPVDLSLLATLEELAGMLARVLDRKRSERLGHEPTGSDALTYLPGRSLFTQRLAEAIATAGRSDQLAAVLFIDLDRFSLINETLGHDIGDRVLRQAAERILACAGKYEQLGRLGGDAFTAVLLDPSDRLEVAAWAEKIRQAFEVPFRVGEHELYVTTSVGISMFPDDGSEASVLVSHARAAVQDAKQERNCARFFLPHMQVATSDRLILEHHLRKAIDRREFLIHYQPQVSLRTGALSGCEALIRWQHPELGLVSPAKFIPLAEETGLIAPLTEWLTRAVCDQQRAWRAAGLPPVRVSINVSAQHFRRGGLRRLMADGIAGGWLDPQLLELEITEGTLMLDVESTVSQMNDLRALGLCFAVDDFGTGYSSLSYLKRIPLSVLKIDQSFVRDLDSDPDDRAIVQAIIALAHQLNLQVVAEGVETDSEREFLARQGCELAQGYLFGRPAPADSFADLLRHAGTLEGQVSKIG
jgi:diguanylate cyclase (GGDEF)-like protein